MKKIVSILFVLFFLVTCEVSANDIIQPFGKLEWEDSISDVLVKIHDVKGVESVKIQIGMDTIDITGIQNSKELAQKLKKESNAKDEHGFAKLAALQGHNLRLSTLEGIDKRILASGIPISLSAKPILVAAIPFEMTITFTSSIGLLVKSPEKALKLTSSKHGDYYVPIVMNGVGLHSESSNLSENIGKLKEIVKNKYKVFGKIVKQEDEDTFRYEAKDKDRRTFEMIGNLMSGRRLCRISYISKVYSKQLDEVYRKHLSQLESDKHKDKQDMSSGI